MEEKLRSAVEPIGKAHLRALRKESFLCSAKCCDSTDTHENLRTCVEVCQQRPAEVEKALAAELQQFHGRLQQCVLACKEDEAAALPKLPEKLAGNAKLQALIDDLLKAKVYSCALKCADDQIATLGPLKKRFGTS